MSTEDASAKGSGAYRPDIDGLRTIAVLAVFLFHLNIPPFSGGFTGVDIFFVISGYLITSVIQRDIHEQRFTIVQFYERRVRRIFPALLTVMVLTFFVAWLLFMPDELRDLGASMAAAITFSSNILFWMQTDYFSGPTDFKPLLHTWSLAVEEQFYIFIPPLMVALHRWLPKYVLPILAALTLISFVASCAWVWIDPSGNYYLPHTRAWELLVGSLVALRITPPIASKRCRDALSVIGLLLLLLPVFLLSKSSIFPAWNAIPTCLGTALLITAGQEHPSLAGRLLSNKPMVGIGLISYSLYLVHWPLIVFAKYALLRDLYASEKILLLGVAFVLAWASWRWIERPFRNPKGFSRKQIFAMALAPSLLCAFAGLIIFRMDGIPQRFKGQIALAVRDTTQTKQKDICFLRDNMKWEQWAGKNCFLVSGVKNEPVTLLWGDSHANHYINALRDTSDRYRQPVLFYGSAGCPPILGVNFKAADCNRNNKHIASIIRDFGVKRVVLSAYWQRYMESDWFGRDDLIRTIQQLRDMGTQVLLIGDNPDFPFANPNYLGVRLSKRDNPNAPFYSSVRNDFSFNAQLAPLVGNDNFYDPLKDFCLNKKCLAYDNGNLLMIDNAHYSKYGSTMALSKMSNIFH
ncbi:MAG: acyltransferase [Sphingobium sp.]|nr:acyltransferase [Sphingobium sp.]